MMTDDEGHCNAAPYLITRKAATQRYSVSLRQLDILCRRNPDFPVLHMGRKVLIHRDKADAWFSAYLGGEIGT